MKHYQATDRELAYFLIKHIENPCVEPQTGLNIRSFYIREAQKLIPTFNDHTAIKILEDTIKKYSMGG
jgi:hypothetical protein